MIGNTLVHPKRQRGCGGLRPDLRTLRDVRLQQSLAVAETLVQP
jgi:hypothetical protein